MRAALWRACRPAGKIERLVRVLIGLPTAVSGLYFRHFSPNGARSALALGALILLSALIPFPQSSDRRPPGTP